MSTPLRKRLSFFIPALACLFCLGSALAGPTRVERPAPSKAAEVTVAGDSPASTGLRFASPATVVLGLVGFAAMLRRPA